MAREFPRRIENSGSETKMKLHIYIITRLLAIVKSKCGLFSQIEEKNAILLVPTRSFSLII